MLNPAASVDGQPRLHETTTYVDVPKTRPKHAVLCVCVSLILAVSGGIYSAVVCPFLAFGIMWFALQWLARCPGLVAVPVASLSTILATGFGWLHATGYLLSAY